MTDLVIGIDLGTTHSLAALLEGKQPRVIANGIGKLLTPSVVSVGESGEIIVGEAALARLLTHPERTAATFKRSMGTTDKYNLGGKVYRPEELSAFVLRQIKDDVEASLGRKVNEAVVTVPAYFGELQRRATRDACEIAGLKVERIINEPTAAALAFGLHERDNEMRAVVIDLGGGTFDVTVLEIVEGVVEIQSSAGDARLGGEDFTEALAQLLAARLEAAHGSRPRDAVATARLKDAAERAKKDLSGGDAARIAILGIDLASGKKVDFDCELLRKDALSAWDEVLRRMDGPVQRALRDAKMQPAEIDEVLLVGGATRMPVVAERMAKFFGKIPRRDLPPDEAIALGAAVQAALKRGDEAVDDLVVTDVAPFTLGVAVSHEVAGRHIDGLFLPILERGTVLPASRSEIVSTMQDRQTKVDIQVYQGEHSSCEKNQLLGKYTVSGIPPNDRGKEQVEVRYTYDLNGLLEVECTIVSTKKKATLVIERSPGLLSKKEVADAQKAMARLKFHPRESLPNVTALGRADALYVNLRAVERQILGQAIKDFQMALESQEPSLIERTRAELNHLTDSLTSR